MLGEGEAAADVLRGGTRAREWAAGALALTLATGRELSDEVRRVTLGPEATVLTTGMATLGGARPAARSSARHE